MAIKQKQLYIEFEVCSVSTVTDDVTIEGTVHPKMKTSPYLLTPMPAERQVRYFCPCNTQVGS